MLLVDGANAYLPEIKPVTGIHPGIGEVCAFGTAADRDGERARLLVVPRDPPLDEAAFAARCAQRLAHFKLPRRIKIVGARWRSAVDG
ncbi:MAG: hypothetical protein ABIQ70_02215 [Dokdonella sp.]